MLTLVTVVIFSTLEDNAFKVVKYLVPNLNSTVVRIKEQSHDRIRRYCEVMVGLLFFTVVGRCESVHSSPVGLTYLVLVGPI